MNTVTDIYVDVVFQDDSYTMLSFSNEPQDCDLHINELTPNIHFINETEFSSNLANTINKFINKRYQCVKELSANFNYKDNSENVYCTDFFSVGGNFKYLGVQ